jgi:capsular exopolysaccharide synthesis family protein
MSPYGPESSTVPPADIDGRSEIDLLAFLSVLRRRWWIIVLVPVLASAGAFAAAHRQTSIYRSTTSILVLPSEAEQVFISQGIDPTRLLQDQIRIIGSTQMTSLVTKRLGFPASVSATASGSDDVIVLTATDTDPRRAANIANAYANAYLSYLLSSSAAQKNQTQQSLTSEIDAAQKQLTQLDQALAAAPPAQQGTVQQSQASQRAALNATVANDQAQLIQDAAVGTQSGAQILAPAPVPTSPISPHPTRTAAIGFGIGIILGLGLAFVRDFLDSRVRGPDDLGRAAKGLPVLASIAPTPGWRDISATHVVSLEDPSAAATEAYRALRTSLQFLAIDRSLKTIQITSPWSGEGKTTTVVNLAVAMAGAGHRVVVVDCDLHRPRIAEFFGLPARVGFTSVLLGDTPLSSALQPVPRVPGLFVLPAGLAPPNPSELLSGRRTGEILARLAAEADFVLVDSPPVLLVSDAAVIATRVDGTVLVANESSTKRSQVHRALQILHQVGSSVIGTVLNRSKPTSATYSPASYSSYRRGKGARYTSPKRNAVPAARSTEPPESTPEETWTAGRPRHEPKRSDKPNRNGRRAPAPESSVLGGERRVKKPVNVVIQRDSEQPRT